MRLPIIIVVFSRFVFASEFERGSEERWGGVLDPFVAISESFLGGLQELELGIVVGTLNKVDKPCQPSLFYDSLVCFSCSSMTR